MGILYRLAIFVLTLLHSASVVQAADETCSRLATINYQDVLVDSSSSKKGEGLRFYLEKDEVAKKLLNQYQESTSQEVRSAIMGTTGTLLMLTGLYRLSNNDRNGWDKVKAEKFWIISGIGMVTLNYFLSRAIDAWNEDLLYGAINEYNKRNLPKIYFNPGINPDNKGFSSGLIQEF